MYCCSLFLSCPLLLFLLIPGAIVLIIAAVNHIVLYSLSSN